MTAGEPRRAGPGARCARSLRLAGPALPVLAAEPLYLLVDTAVVGRLGAVPLAGLAVAGVVFAQVTGQLNFLSYGTTARAARLHGAGRRSAAVGEGVQATWLALAVGLVVLGVGQLVAGPVARALGDGGAVAAAAESWLRIALCGAPLVLVTLAGNGWMRGVQDTVRPLRYVLAGNGLSALLCPLLVHGVGPGRAGARGLGGGERRRARPSAPALFLAALRRERAAAPADAPVALRPVPGAAARAARAWAATCSPRSLAFQACFLSAAAVAARFGAPTVAAHQIVLQLWVFRRWCSTRWRSRRSRWSGRRSAAGDVRRARGAGPAGRAATGWCSGRGSACCSPRWPGCCRAVFTTDAAVLAAVPVAWWFFVGDAAGGRRRVRPRRGAARRRGRRVPAHDDPARRGRRVPAADLGVAGVRLGAGRDLDGAARVHAGPAGGGAAAGPLGPLGGGGARSAR